MENHEKLQRICRQFERPRSVWVIAGLAVVLVLPSLSDRLVLDDHVLALLQRDETGIRGLRSGALDLFTFTTGDVETNRALMDEGALLPWWADERHLNAFLRPLSSLTHLLDFHLWPNAPLLMHVHSILWFGALLLVIARLYRDLSPLSPTPTWSPAPTWLSGLAFLLFALDDAHGVTVGWIANRNAIAAATFALLALGAHHRLRSQRWRPGAYLAPFYLAVGLLAGETAIAVCGYLLAYAIFLDRAPASERLRSLWPYAALVLLELGTHRVLGLGSFGSGAYHDPAREPIAFAAALVRNLPILLSAQLGIPVADLTFWGAPQLWLPLFALSLITLAALFAAALPIWRRDAHGRFWTLGMVLAAIPVAASLPGERLLLMVGVGASPLVASILFSLAREAAPQAPNMPRPLRGAIFAFLAVLHLVVAPLLLPVRARSMEVLGAAMDRADRSIPMTEAITQKTAVIVNAPFDVMASYIQVMRQSRRQPRPRHLYWLSTASSPLHVSRVGERTLRIRPRHGFIYTPPEQHYRGDFSAFSKGQVIRLSEMNVHINDRTADGRPAEADFTFSAPLDSGRYLFLSWVDGEYKPFNMPAQGQSVRLPAQDFFRIVFSTIVQL